MIEFTILIGGHFVDGSIQMAELRMTIEKKDAELRKQMESSRTLADRQMCDFRHKMSKLQDSHQEIVDSLEHKHAQEIGNCP